MTKMKKCIWCRNTEELVSFNTPAHTIPKSLGGKFICENVCDDCNKHFGNRKDNKPAIDETIKEVFNIAREKLFFSLKEDNPWSDKFSKKRKRYTSRYFKVDHDKGKIKLKRSNTNFYRQSFRMKLADSFKKGIYKIFLEEIERQEQDGHNPKYDFIRDYARFDFGEYPVYYFQRIIPVFGIIENEILHPTIRFKNFGYLYSGDGFVEIELLGQVFGFPVIRRYDISIDNYFRKTKTIKKIGNRTSMLFHSIKEIKYITDIDLALNGIRKS